MTLITQVKWIMLFETAFSCEQISTYMYLLIRVSYYFVLCYFVIPYYAAINIYFEYMYMHSNDLKYHKSSF